MARRRYLIAYDIAHPKRLRRVCVLMEDHGYRLQYSVFVCDLSKAELAELESAVVNVMDLMVDSVISVDLGATGSAARITTIGRGRGIPPPGPRIV